jgi:hypothetical protein
MPTFEARSRRRVVKILSTRIEDLIFELHSIGSLNKESRNNWKRPVDIERNRLARPESAADAECDGWACREMEMNDEGGDMLDSMLPLLVGTLFLLARTSPVPSMLRPGAFLASTAAS